MMEHIVGMPFDSWPARDRELWAAAAATDCSFDASAMARWKPSTIKAAGACYGIWLKWLRENDLLKHPDPASRLSTTNLKAFIKDEIGRGVGLRTTADRAHRVISVVASMCADVDKKEVRRIANRVEKAAERQWQPHGVIVHASALYNIGVGLVRQAAVVGLRTHDGAGLYIDGLAIALLAACPTRLGTFCRLRLNVEIVRDSSKWQMLIPGENTKANKMEIRFIPLEVTPLLDDYLQIVRPFLLARRPQSQTDRLFIGASGIPLQDQVMRKRIVHRTLAATGKRILPHDFRKSALTTLVLEQPRHAPSAPLLLSHTGARTAEKHYIIRQQMLALGNYHTVLNAAAKRGPGEAT